MGFDIKCIIDIHTYPGEYFCLVFYTLVCPNEAVQSQCTHLFCKSCLAHVANGSRACPYDGYLVIEADSKALNESDKTLAESTGRVKTTIVAQDNPSFGAATTAFGIEANQMTTHSVNPASQTPNPQTTTASLLPGQDPN
ncbi:hypothetical protein RDI58_026880 [Solanum bulbocastanum]|uniref:Zinc finger C3HC4 RING-type domain-containing protein n=1 Tax=Solanum bulbocastanum TaxID=147425 RepID=A0AAN8SXQ6_SOLBU